MSLRLLACIAAACVALSAHAQPGPAAKMRAESQALIDTIGTPGRAKLVLAFADEKRADWHYTPRSRPGLSFADMDARQREAVHRLLKSALSVAGHRKVVNVIELELVLRVLAAEEDEARKLLELLDAAQRRMAVVDSRTYGEIVTGARERVSPIDNRGLEARAMTDTQKAQLTKLIEVYADNFEPHLRSARLARAAEGFEAIRFAWAGATERGGQHYYRVQGPKFLIEYDSSQNDGNHIHTVWRDYDGDFGRDLLREHHSMTRGTSHRH